MTSSPGGVSASIARSQVQPAERLSSRSQPLSRTTLASYRTAVPQWETVLDVDVLAKADGKPWVFHGATCLAPAYERCMVSLSPGGSDASVQREFDTKTKEFVSGGFVLPEAKSFIAWRDQDTLWLGTDFGPGSLTSSGYPRIVKLWKRGTPVSAARTVFEGREQDVASGGTTDILSDGRYDLITRTPACSAIFALPSVEPSSATIIS